MYPPLVQWTRCCHNIAKLRIFFFVVANFYIGGRGGANFSLCLGCPMGQGRPCQYLVLPGHSGKLSVITLMYQFHLDLMPTSWQKPFNYMRQWLWTEIVTKLARNCDTSVTSEYDWFWGGTCSCKYISFMPITKRKCLATEPWGIIPHFVSRSTKKFWAFLCDLRLNVTHMFDSLHKTALLPWVPLKSNSVSKISAWFFQFTEFSVCRQRNFGRTRRRMQGRTQEIFREGGGKFSWGQREWGSGYGTPLVKGSAQFANERNQYSY
jgi:hypothetical protein